MRNVVQVVDISTFKMVRKGQQPYCDIIIVAICRSFHIELGKFKDDGATVVHSDEPATVGYVRVVIWEVLGDNRATRRCEIDTATCNIQCLLIRYVSNRVHS